jgi:hypothetical protein
VACSGLASPKSMAGRPGTTESGKFVPRTGRSVDAPCVRPVRRPERRRSPSGLRIARASRPRETTHFVGRCTATLEANGDLTVTWKEAGLGDNQLIDYLASADGTATYVCVNNGGECPNAANKITVSGPVSAKGTFSSGQNGQIKDPSRLNHRAREVSSALRARP